MPIYEYECSACKFYVEALQKISEPPLSQCPSCKKTALKRLMSAPAFRLKGGGWYETDFKSDQENKRNLAGREEAAEAKPAEADAKADSKADSKESAKASESKPAAAKAAPKKKAAAKPAAKTPVRSAKAKAKPAKKAPAKKKARR